VIAVRARRNDICPDVLPAQVTRHDMVHGQTAFALSTVLAGIIVAAKDFPASQFHVWTRSMNLGLQPDDRRSWQQLLHRSDVPTPVYHHVRLARKEQADGPSRGTNIDRFEIGIEYQHRFVHSLPPQQAGLYC
jgi:hypothetical protein